MFMFMMFMFQQDPIVVEVLKQPPVAREITMGDVVLGAMGLSGVIMLAAAAVGLLVGAVVIFIKRRRDAVAPPTDPGHARLRIQS
jgi:hypothetical protein